MRTTQQILEDVKDLINTLKNPNFYDKGVKDKWDKKYHKVREEIDALPKDQLGVIEKEYAEWFEKKFKNMS